jgi:hypothetical protein
MPGQGILKSEIHFVKENEFCRLHTKLFKRHGKKRNGVTIYSSKQRFFFFDYIRKCQKLFENSKNIFLCFKVDERTE